ncbi:MAG: BrxA family protein [Candidatus Pelethousia sp.]|nr:BrxA family protein [Candidatus Pelethousia sp.]
MQYSAGMMAIPFLFIETRKTAALVEYGLAWAEIKHEVLSENIYQMSSQYQAERYFNMICRRIACLSARLVQETARDDLQTAKLLVMITIMHTDLLFREFMMECFFEQLQLGRSELDDVAINGFFSLKATQSDIVAA